MFVLFEFGNENALGDEPEKGLEFADVGLYIQSGNLRGLE